MAVVKTARIIRTGTEEPAAIPLYATPDGLGVVTKSPEAPIHVNTGTSVGGNIRVSGNSASHQLEDLNGPADEKVVQQFVNNGEWRLRGLNDAISGETVAGIVLDLDTGNVGFGAATSNEEVTLAGTGIFSIKEGVAPTATADYGKIWTESNNELFFQDGDGDTHLLHGPAFGDLWHHGVGADTVTISAQDQATLIDSFSVVGGADDLGNVTGSASTNLLTVGADGDGDHDIGWHASFTVGGGAKRVMILMAGIVLASPNTVTGATETTPISLTIGSHVYENGDLIEIVSVGGNTASNGTRIVQNVAATTVDLYDTQGAAVASNGTCVLRPGDLFRRGAAGSHDGIGVVYKSHRKGAE